MSIDDVGQSTSEIDRISLPEQETNIGEQDAKAASDNCKSNTNSQMVEIIGKWPRSILNQFDKRTQKYNDESEKSNLKKLEIAIKMDSQYTIKREKCRIKASEQRSALKKQLQETPPHSKEPEIIPIYKVNDKVNENEPEIIKFNYKVIDKVNENEPKSMTPKSMTPKSMTAKKIGGARSLFTF